MFTGIVQGLATIVDVASKPDFATFTIAFPDKSTANLQIGASVAINGTCLTVTQVNGNQATFDVMQETLRVTNLADQVAGSQVNFERAARFGDEIGGHMLSGHIHALAKIVAIQRSEHNTHITLEAPVAWQKYLFSKGYVSLNGASLTIGEVQGNRFDIHLIPETLRMTTFGHCQVGDAINVEVDSHTQIIVDTLERMGLQAPCAS